MAIHLTRAVPLPPYHLSSLPIRMLDLQAILAKAIAGTTTTSSDRLTIAIRTIPATAATPLPTIREIMDEVSRLRTTTTAVTMGRQGMIPTILPEAPTSLIMSMAETAILLTSKGPRPRRPLKCSKLLPGSEPRLRAGTVESERWVVILVVREKTGV